MVVVVSGVVVVVFCAVVVVCGIVVVLFGSVVVVLVLNAPKIVAAYHQILPTMIGCLVG